MFSSLAADVWKKKKEEKKKQTTYFVVDFSIREERQYAKSKRCRKSIALHLFHR